MTSILIDSAGTPIINAQGNMFTVSGNVEFRQRLTNIFSTQRGTETIFPEYGFDYMNYSRSIGRIDRSIGLRSYASDALNPRNVLNMKELVDMSVTVTGTTGFIALNLLTNNGQIISQSLQLGE